MLTLTLETSLQDATHWRTRSMAAQSGLSHSTVHRVWRAFGLQPHRTETFKISSDPLFIEKVRDIVGLYLSPPDRAMVLCVDEKARIQSLLAPARCCLKNIGRVGAADEAKGCDVLAVSGGVEERLVEQAFGYLRDCLRS